MIQGIFAVVISLFMSISMNMASLPVDEVNVATQQPADYYVDMAINESDDAASVNPYEAVEDDYDGEDFGWVEETPGFAEGVEYTGPYVYGEEDVYSPEKIKVIDKDDPIVEEYLAREEATGESRDGDDDEIPQSPKTQEEIEKEKAEEDTSWVYENPGFATGVEYSGPYNNFEDAYKYVEEPEPQVYLYIDENGEMQAVVVPLTK